MPSWVGQARACGSPYFTCRPFTSTRRQEITSRTMPGAPRTTRAAPAAPGVQQVPASAQRGRADGATGVGQARERELRRGLADQRRCDDALVGRGFDPYTQEDDPQRE